MSDRHRIAPSVRSRASAILVVVAVLACVAAAPGWPEEAPPPTGPGSVVVIPFVLDGRVDKVLTSEFLEQLASKETGWRLVEVAAVAQKLPKGEKLESDTKIEALLKAAKAAGAEAVILGRAARYKVLDAPGIQLKVSMVEVEAGGELHKEVTKASAWTSERAKREAARTATKKLLKELGRG